MTLTRCPLVDGCFCYTVGVTLGSSVMSSEELSELQRVNHSCYKEKCCQTLVGKQGEYCKNSPRKHFLPTIICCLEF